jgi:5-formyltetrahydrofolate cyclo-ligase
MTVEQLAAARAAVRETVLQAAAEARATWHNVFAYDPLPREPGSVELLAALTGRGAAVRVPVTLPDRDLDWRGWPAADVLGVQAIVSATVVVVPALAVDRRGMRLGRGGGSYDRALARVPAGVPVVALLHRGELVDELPAEPWDRPVGAVVTPDGWWQLAAPLGTDRSTAPG